MRNDDFQVLGVERKKRQRNRWLFVMLAVIAIAIAVGLGAYWATSPQTVRTGTKMGAPTIVPELQAAADSLLNAKLTEIEGLQGQAIVMDVGLPDGDGVALCREWRAMGDTRPILFLTARDEEFDVVRGLDSGGNDYVTKPFRMQELLSRVRVLLCGSAPRRVTARGGFTVDETRLQITRDGEALPLTLTEYRILVLLLESKGVVSRDRLLQLLWDDGGKYIDDNTLSVHMSRLREKVGAAQIRTIRGVGYQWSDM